jgi:hypothetical protein
VVELTSDVPLGTAFGESLEFINTDDKRMGSRSRLRQGCLQHFVYGRDLSGYPSSVEIQCSGGGYLQIVMVRAVTRRPKGKLRGIARTKATGGNRPGPRIFGLQDCALRASKPSSLGFEPVA